MLRLTLSVEGAKPAVFESDDPVLSVGRGAACTLVLADETLAERHLQFERTPEGGWKVVDLETPTGTTVNGAAVNVAVLQDGDIVRAGRSEIRVELGGDPAEARTDRVRVVRLRRRGRLTRRVPLPAPRPPAEKVFTLDDFRTILSSLVDERGPGVLDEARRLLDQAFEEHLGAPVFELLEIERDNLRRIVEINRLLAGERDLRRLLEFILDSVVEFAGAERGFLILREGATLAIRTARNFDKEAVKRPEFKVSHTIAEEVLRSGKPVLSADAMNDPGLPAAHSVSDLRLRSLLCVPMRARDRVLGCLYVDNRFEANVFSESDVPLLQALADQAALAIETAGLLEREERRAAELAASREEVARLNEQLREKVERQYAELAKVKEDLLAARPQEPLKHDFSSIVGRSRPMHDVLRLLDRILDTDEPVYLHGESGTGKELVARAIHFNSSRARTGKFVGENCSAIPDSLLESELFGHEKGAFTGAVSAKAGLFEAAHRGTLFLDEVGDMSLDMQKKLLRAVQEGEIRRVGGSTTLKVDVRLLSASNKDLGALIKEGRFREDLYYRLNVVQITLPPLRERREDLPILVEHLLDRIARESGRPKRNVSEAALRLLQLHTWPGNVRELENELRRAVALADEDITPECLKPEIRDLDALPPLLRLPASGALKEIVREAVADVERRVILKALEDSRWKKSEAARALGISRPTLDAKIEAYRLAP